MIFGLITSLIKKLESYFHIIGSLDLSQIIYSNWKWSHLVSLKILNQYLAPQVKLFTVGLAQQPNILISNYYIKAPLKPQLILLQVEALTQHC